MTSFPDRSQRRLGTSGYLVALPNLYHRTTPAFSMDHEDPASKELMLHHNRSLVRDQVRVDVSAILDRLESEPDAATGMGIGCVGYCMAGPFALDIASAYATRIAAAASIYGVRLVTDSEDSPHLGLSSVEGELYIGCADGDPYAPNSMIEDLAGHLAASSCRHRIEWFDGEHGAVFPQRPAFDKHVAERHWQRLIALFNRNPAQAAPGA